MVHFLKSGGEEGDGDGQFRNPSHVAVDSNNNIYVSNNLTGLFHLPPRMHVQKFTANGDFILGWGEFGFTDGQFRTPRGIAVESGDVILIVDPENHRIQKFSSNGEFITKWGRYEFGDGLHLGSAIDIAVDSNDDSYVIDQLHDVVKKFDRAHNFIRQWGSQGIGDGEFDFIAGIATFSGNSILVTDSSNSRIQEFSRDGVFITKWGSFGTQPSQFSHPTGVAINKSDDMHYIADTANNRIQRFHWDPTVP